ncbi:MAG: gluconate 2-dehydrogenase subunit 3 family protein [Lewinellaceae bacterium]|nr:gluconate 2-dehydrogenase subunit 3 family protein [Saprospiraceae bacterium]MCB9330188.1 gluconate 2-dehydrogenase subunit 3 family protein [Lewinellaceae bacterium]
MKRREAIQRLSTVLGGTLLGADSLLARQIDWESIETLPESARIGLFGKRQIRLLNEIADTILPETDTPGAKAAKVGQFMAVIVSDCWEKDDQELFLAGLVALEERCKKTFGKPFLRCTPQQRHALLVELDEEQKEYYRNIKDGDPPHYFRQMKDLTLWGYFTSEIGATQALRFVDIPGRYEGCIPYEKGDRAWGG